MELAEFLKKKKPKKPIFVYLSGRSQKQVSSLPLLGYEAETGDVVSCKRKICETAGMIVIQRFDKIGEHIKNYLSRENQTKDK